MHFKHCSKWCLVMTLAIGPRPNKFLVTNCSRSKPHTTNSTLDQQDADLLYHWCHLLKGDRPCLDIDWAIDQVIAYYTSSDWGSLWKACKDFWRNLHLCGDRLVLTHWHCDPWSQWLVMIVQAIVAEKLIVSVWARHFGAGHVLAATDLPKSEKDQLKSSVVKLVQLVNFIVLIGEGPEKCILQWLPICYDVLL